MASIVTNREVDGIRVTKTNNGWIVYLSLKHAGFVTYVFETKVAMQKFVVNEMDDLGRT